MMEKQTDLRSDLARIRAQSTDVAPVHEILCQAAVVTHFDLFELSLLHDDSDEAMLLLMDHALPLHTPDEAWGLALNTRQQIIARFQDRASVLTCLDTIQNRPGNQTQKAFEFLMSSPTTVQDVLQSGDAAAIADIVDVLAWIERAPQLQAGLPDADTAATALEEARRMAPLRRLVGEHFEGRKDVLDQMQAYLNAPDGQNVLFLHGPGGIGKSTVLAKFAMDAANRDDVEAIVYLNLDRPVLRPDEPLSLLLDLLSQLARQFPEASGPLREVSTTVHDFEHRLSYSNQDQSLLESAAAAGHDWDWIVNDAARAIAGLPGERIILILVDTFEQAQRRGAQVVSELWRITNLLTNEAPRLRIIAAGRLEEQQFTDNRIPLEAFERSDVERILNRASKTPLAPALVDEIYELTDGHPLTVQLAASFVGRAGIGAFDDPELREQKLSGFKVEKRDALLYGRILQQISDPLVQQIAVAGLIMRRITPEVIRQVLAEACGLTFYADQEWSLYAQLAEEVDLVSVDYSDPNGQALVHEPNVRTLMLNDLRLDPSVSAHEIDVHAIEYFSGLPGEYARAEEIYHRIWRGDNDNQLEDRWMPGVAPLLVSALDDLPVERQAWLANKLGISPSPEKSGMLGLPDWERSAATQARQMLQRGDAEGVLALLSERQENTLGSEIYAIKAEAHMALGDETAGLATLDLGIAAARQAKEDERLAELLLLRSQTRERQRHFTESSRDAVQALDIADRLENQEYRLRATAALLRLNRKSRSTVGPTRESLKLNLHEFIDTPQSPDSAQMLPKLLYKNPGLTRELAAEIGVDHPKLLDLSLQQTGSVSKPKNDVVGGKFTQEILRLLSGMEIGNFGKLVRKISGSDDGDVIQNLPELIAIARDRRILDQVKKPLSWLLSAEVDRQVGAFPSKSMIKRTTGVQISED